ncbi:hypothetical protein SAMN02990966_00356 [Rhodospirillales bacterium URHD0017]|nr:hypothetical protein SAMN02990966_00356 [Rhodospirillales bacterium URHD0017]
MTAVTTGERLFLRATSPRIADRVSEIDVQKEAQLLSFFLAFTADERRDRFGRVVTDDFIRDWRAGLTASRYCAVGRERNGKLIAVVELFGQATDWSLAELALCGGRLAEDSSLRLALVRSALFAAETLGASEVTIQVCRADHALELADGLGGHYDPTTGTLTFRSCASVAWPIWPFHHAGEPRPADRRAGA